MKYTSHKEKGSFLIELLVAFAIISIAMTVIVDAFVSSQHSYYTTSEKADLVSVLTFLLEDMTREARVSDNFRCDSPPCVNASNFSMTHIEDLNDAGPGEDIRYYKSGTSIYKTDGSSLPMTPTSITVTNFNVDVMGTPPIDPVRARITIGAYSNERPDQELNLQTSFTVRDY